MCPPLARSPAGNCPTDACTLDYENEEAGGSGQLYELLTLGNPSPTATFCVVADEGNTDGSVGDGWSHSGLTDFAGYGYIHGSCVDESGGPNCGLFGYSDENVYGSSGAIELTSKTFELPAHNGVTLSMRVWKQGSYDHWETVGITADGATVWESEPLQHGCISGWTNDELGSDSSEYCWSITYDCYIDVELDIAHTASTLTVGFTLHGDENCGNEGVGFSDFKLTVAPLSGSCAPTAAPTLTPAPSLTPEPSVTSEPTAPRWFMGEITCGSNIVVRGAAV